MRLATIAEVHANLPALQAVPEDAQAHGVDAYLVAGDLLAGLHPDACVRLLQSLRALMIRGNTDINNRRAPGPALPISCLRAARVQ